MCAGVFFIIKKPEVQVYCKALIPLFFFFFNVGWWKTLLLKIISTALKRACKNNPARPSNCCSDLITSSTYQDRFRPMTEGETARGRAVFVLCACSVCRWHKPALQTHTECYLISLASRRLGYTTLSAEQTHVDSKHFRYYFSSASLCRQQLEMEVQVFMQ